MNEQDTADLTPLSRTFPQWIADRNPFFLVSGVLMLAGCFMINGSAHDDPDVVWPIVGLVLVFNVYEFLVIGLSVYLYRRKGFHRDTGFLLLLEALLLCDVSLAYNELILKSLAIGAVVSSMAVAMAGVKLLMIDRGLGLRTTKRGAWLMTTLIALLFLLPGVLREMRRAEVLHEWHFYMAWWLLGALLLVAAVSQPWFVPNQNGDKALAGLRRWAAGLLIVVPLVSLFIHLRASHYMHDHVFHAYSYAPIVLGLTAAWIYMRSIRATPQRLAVVSVIGACVAVGLSLRFPEEAMLTVFASGYGVVSPLRMVMPTAAVLLIYVWWRRGVWVCLPPAAGLIVASGLGHSVSSITGRVQELFKRLRPIGAELVPDTMLGWGSLAVAASFVFLFLGALTSAMTPRRDTVENRTD